VQREGVLALRVEGNFDECQRLVKGAFSDPALSGVHLSTANSINIGRLLPQMLYYVWATKCLQSSECTFVVPSGNLGNLTAGIMAHMSGMPVHQFVAAHNENDFFPQYLLNPSSGFSSSVRTISNAMDVGAPSNFERLNAMMHYKELRALVRGQSFSNDETIASMQRVYKETGYVADPHTAVGLAAARTLLPSTPMAQPIVVLSTAHPAKFPDIVEKAIETEVPIPQQLKELEALPDRVTDLKPDAGRFAEMLLSNEW